MSKQAALPRAIPVSPDVTVDQVIRTSELWKKVDCDDPDFQASIHNGSVRTLAPHSYRRSFEDFKGEGSAEVIGLGDGQLINIPNGQMPPIRQRYLADEALIMLRASLSCDVSYSVAGSEPMVFRRPEVILAYIPAGVTLIVDIGSGPQQGVISFQRAADFAERYGLDKADLPPMLKSALAGQSGVGRIASFPLDSRLAALVVQIMESALAAQLRVLQCVSRIGELVALTLHAMESMPVLRGKAVVRRRDADLAYAAHERLSREYRTPPRFADLAHALGTNQTKLKAVFREVFGVTMSDYCLQSRIREAQQMLVADDLSISMIAERVGYQHQSSFAAAFVCAVGMSPSDYRKHRAPFVLPLTNQALAPM